MIYKPNESINVATPCFDLTFNSNSSLTKKFSVEQSLYKKMSPEHHYVMKSKFQTPLNLKSFSL